MNIEGLEWLKDRTVTEENLTVVRNLSKFSKEFELA